MRRDALRLRSGTEEDFISATTPAVETSASRAPTSSAASSPACTSTTTAPCAKTLRPATPLTAALVPPTELSISLATTSAKPRQVAVDTTAIASWAKRS